MARLSPLFSGSSGNSYYIGSRSAGLLIDAGRSARQIDGMLKVLGINPLAIQGILVTHEHSDHVSGLRVLSKKAGAAICATRPTLWEWYKKNRCDEVKALFRPHEAGTGFQIGSLWVESFPTPHDAAGSVGWSIAGEGGRMVLCTDLGHVTEPVRQAVAGCDLLVCESNHDVDWVKSGPYSYYLKQRILGDYGHLSNEAGAELAGFAAESGTRAVVLAHLSQTNNTPARAYEAAALRLLALGFDPERDISLSVAPHDTLGSTWSPKEVSVC